MRNGTPFLLSNRDSERAAFSPIGDCELDAEVDAEDIRPTGVLMALYHHTKKGGCKNPATGIAGLEAPLPGLCCNPMMVGYGSLNKSTEVASL